MNRKELTKTFMMIANGKKISASKVFTRKLSILKLHSCFVYFIQTINPWRGVLFFYFTAPVTELLRI